MFKFPGQLTGPSAPSLTQQCVLVKVNWYCGHLLGFPCEALGFAKLKELRARYFYASGACTLLSGTRTVRKLIV
jgi:hypothetical protein